MFYTEFKGVISSYYFICPYCLSFIGAWKCVEGCPYFCLGYVDASSPPAYYCYVS
ncbi:hypothetical protein [Methanobrevibacter woesei]|uniref:hypothetical protein n=1 Tax=Methanobrevibacter woesei TaxID=190976 RepID=UPI00255BE56D|nr:hypothetical protein [Methanobrevibacter woesei]